MIEATTFIKVLSKRTFRFFRPVVVPSRRRYKRKSNGHPLYAVHRAPDLRFIAGADRRRRRRRLIKRIYVEDLRN